MSGEDFVKVRICANEHVEYQQTLKLPKSEFELLKKALGSEDWKERAQAAQEVREWINTYDIYSSDDFEIDDFSLATPDVEGESL